MKPTQQEIIELAREQGLYLDGINTQLPLYVLKQEELVSLVHLALERFGAGGGEPVAWIDGTDLELMRKDGRGCIAWGAQKHSNATTPLYTRPSPTDLRAEYLRGLEDAAKVCDEVSLQANASWKMAYRPQDQGRETGADECADAIRALKGKQ